MNPGCPGCMGLGSLPACMRGNQAQPGNSIRPEIASAHQMLGGRGTQCHTRAFLSCCIFRQPYARNWDDWPGNNLKGVWFQQHRIPGHQVRLCSSRKPEAIMKRAGTHHCPGRWPPPKNRRWISREIAPRCFPMRDRCDCPPWGRTGGTGRDQRAASPSPGSRAGKLKFAGILRNGWPVKLFSWPFPAQPSNPPVLVARAATRFQPSVAKKKNPNTYPGLRLASEMIGQKCLRSSSPVGKGEPRKQAARRSSR